jgi:addiction module HigA family antidote
VTSGWASIRLPGLYQNLTARKFAEHIHVPHNAVTGIINGERSISAQMAIRLGQAFDTTPQYWLNLQAIHDLKQAWAEMPAEALQIGPYAASLVHEAAHGRRPVA